MLKVEVRVCDVCHERDGSIRTDAVGYYFPDIDKPKKVDVCKAHKEWAEKKGFVVWEYDED